MPCPMRKRNNPFQKAIFGYVCFEAEMCVILIGPQRFKMVVLKTKGFGGKLFTV